MVEIQKLNEQLNKILNEDFQNEFKLTNLHYKITYNSGNSYEKTLSIVDTLNYKLYDLDLAQIADIVLKNTEDNGFLYQSEDSSYIKYDPETGIIKNISPIIFTDNNGEVKGTISFEMVLWAHPQELGV